MTLQYQYNEAGHPTAAGVITKILTSPSHLYIILATKSDWPMRLKELVMIILWF